LQIIEHITLYITLVCNDLQASILNFDTVML